MAILVRLPEHLLDEVRQIAAEEERPLNTQVLRFIRAGLEQYRTEHPRPEQAENEKPE